MQTQIDILILLMQDRGLRTVTRYDPVLQDVWDELVFQERQPKVPYARWETTFMGRIPADERFIGRQFVVRQQKRLRVYELKEGTPEPERDYPNASNVLYAMNKLHRAGYGWLTVERIAGEFECKLGSVRHRLLRMSKAGLVESLHGHTHGYKIPGTLVEYPDWLDHTDVRAK